MSWAIINRSDELVRGGRQKQLAARRDRELASQRSHAALFGEPPALRSGYCDFLPVAQRRCKPAIKTKSGGVYGTGQSRTSFNRGANTAYNAAHASRSLSRASLGGGGGRPSLGGVGGSIGSGRPETPVSVSGYYDPPPVEPVEPPRERWLPGGGPDGLRVSVVTDGKRDNDGVTKAGHRVPPGNKGPKLAPPPEPEPVPIEEGPLDKQRLAFAADDDGFGPLVVSSGSAASLDLGGGGGGGGGSNVSAASFAASGGSTGGGYEAVGIYGEFGALATSVFDDQSRAHTHAGQPPGLR